MVQPHYRSRIVRQPTLSTGRRQPRPRPRPGRAPARDRPGPGGHRRPRPPGRPRVAGIDHRVARADRAWPQAGGLRMNASATDTRRKPRRRVPDTVSVVDSMTDQVVGRLGNVSETGMLLIASTPLVDDGLYQLRFELSDHEIGRAHV